MSDCIFPIKTHDRHEMKFPFHKVNGFRGFSYWAGGCILEEYDYSRSFKANGEGKVVYEVLSVAKMPKRYQDRVVFKRTLIDPDGNKTPSKVCFKTVKSFTKDVQSGAPFKGSYEVEA